MAEITPVGDSPSAALPQPTTSAADLHKIPANGAVDAAHEIKRAGETADETARQIARLQFAHEQLHTSAPPAAAADIQNADALSAINRAADRVSWTADSAAADAAKWAYDKDIERAAEAAATAADWTYTNAFRPTAPPDPNSVAGSDNATLAIGANSAADSTQWTNSRFADDAAWNYNQGPDAAGAPTAAAANWTSTNPTGLPPGGSIVPTVTDLRANGAAGAHGAQDDGRHDDET